MPEPHQDGRGLNWREVAAAFGVILSLLFVGFEVRQNTIAVRGQTREALAADVQNWIMAMATDEELSELTHRVFTLNEEVSAPDSARLFMAIFALVRHHENVFLQIREGALGESGFQSYGWSENTYYEHPFFVDRWLTVRHRFHPAFVEAFEGEYR